MGRFLFGVLYMADDGTQGNQGNQGHEANQSAEKKLTFKQQRFVLSYVGASKGNATKAAVAAGYSEKTASSIGQENLTKPAIAAAISERVSEYAMSPVEVLAEYADIARYASVVPLLKFGSGDARPSFAFSDDQGNPKPEMRFVKSVKVTEGNTPSVSVELHDRMAALDRLAKFHNLQIDRLKVEMEQTSVNVNLTVGDVEAARLAVRAWEQERRRDREALGVGES